MYELRTVENVELVVLKGQNHGALVCLTNRDCKHGGFSSGMVSKKYSTGQRTRSTQSEYNKQCHLCNGTVLLNTHTHTLSDELTVVS